MHVRSEVDQPPDAEAEWTVDISIRERDGRACATARLRIGDRESVGVGLSGLGVAEHGFSGAGRDLAVAHALSDLASRVRAREHDDRHVD